MAVPVQTPEEAVDARWRAALRSYGFDTEGTPEEVVAKAASAFRERDWRWREEIEKYLPQLGVMSFCGPASTIRWLVNHLGLDPQAKALADTLKAIADDKTLSDDERVRRRLETIFPNLRSDGHDPGRQEGIGEGAGG